jgi:aminopeptidase
LDKLADVLTSHSTKLKSGEKVLIDIFDAPDEMAISLIQATRAIGAIPFVQMHHARVSREIALGADEAQLTIASSVELARMKKMDAYIAVRGSHNITEMSDADQ